MLGVGCSLMAAANLDCDLVSSLPMFSLFGSLGISVGLMTKLCIIAVLMFFGSSFRQILRGVY
ncbi:unnamed protein product [Moneuplotes crassus]|uniref:Uncharacterized protein n=1 Tax=Euplotes crassus TaxID=5936 RepID=A0AAD1Y780_EUPCR|nr:unnamed protein product [Moneuplotes crassus]